MVIGDALRQAVQTLVCAGIETAALDARVLLMAVLGVDAVYLAVHRDVPLTAEQHSQYDALIRRRAKHQPVAYLTGEREFMSLSFLVRPGVLIPRPDTEILAEYAIGQCRKIICPAVLDICTGSGALAVSIAHFVPEAQVTAVDIADDALDTARANAARHGVQVAVLRRDVLSGWSDFSGTFDVVVSNPPYIRRGEIAGLPPDVRDFEPHLALDGGTDGLDFYRVLVHDLPQLLKPGGIAAFEVGYDQADAVAALLKERFAAVETIRDLSGQPRVVAGRLR